MQSSAATVAQYIAELDDVRRPQIISLRKLIKKHLPKGYKETMAWGGICYEVPMSVSGPTYNKQPLVYAGLASQKQYITLHLYGLYASPELTKEFQSLWAESGKKLRMGRGCVWLKNADAVAPLAVAKALEACTPEQFVDLYLTATNRKK